jgi:hypothetical protein
MHNDAKLSHECTIYNTSITAVIAGVSVGVVIIVALTVLAIVAAVCAFLLINRRRDISKYKKTSHKDKKPKGEEHDVERDYGGKRARIVESDGPVTQHEQLRQRPK